MIYYLKNKDKILLQFEICNVEIDDYLKEKQYKQEIRNIQVFSDLMPINLDKNDLQNSLKKWIENRRVPYNRKFVEKIIATYANDFNQSFTNQTYGYLPIYNFLTSNEIKKDKADLLNTIAKIYTDKKLKDMLLFDAIIYNSDRHLGNFGMLINNNILEIIKPAPIFDNGFSIMKFLMETELSNIENAFKDKCYFFGYNFDEQLLLSAEKRHLESLKNLSQFEFIRHSEFNLDEVWLQSIENHIRKRAEKVINYLK